MISQSLYDILGVLEDASPEEIKAAYRRKMGYFHPDRGGSKEAARQVNAANEVLSDPAKRTAYDRSRRSGRSDGVMMCPLCDEPVVSDEQLLGHIVRHRAEIGAVNKAAEAETRRAQDELERRASIERIRQERAAEERRRADEAAHEREVMKEQRSSGFDFESKDTRSPEAVSPPPRDKSSLGVSEEFWAQSDARRERRHKDRKPTALAGKWPLVAAIGCSPIVLVLVGIVGFILYLIVVQVFSSVL